MIKNQKRKILITGGTGFIGSKLCLKLIELGFQLTVLSRKTNLINRDSISYINDLDQIEFDFDIVINLSGAPIAVRWSEKNQKEIYASRIDVTRKIVEKINQAKNPPSLFISGSAIGYYGTSESIVFNEKSLPTKENLFSQKLCQDWENEAKKAEDKTVVVRIRTGVVLGSEGGMIKKISPIFKLGLGGKIGSGNQILSWIHIDDEVAAIIHLIENQKISGAVNLTTPLAISNAEFTKVFAANLKKPAIFNAPALAMKLVYGEMAQELLLKGQKVYPEVLIDSGFSFQFPDLKTALENI
jgi:uncharacterized protein (TIGR01777 family)